MMRLEIKKGLSGKIVAAARDGEGKVTVRRADTKKEALLQLKQHFEDQKRNAYDALSLIYNELI